LQSYYREQFNSAIAGSDCNAALDYGQKLLATSTDSEVDRAMKECASKQPRVQP